MTNYSNPADKLSIIASQPRTVLNSDVQIRELAKVCMEQQAQNMFLSEQEITDWNLKLQQRFS